jgi:hypothetical protein
MKRKKNVEPKKSTRRYGGRSDSKQDKQTLKEKRKKKILGSGAVVFQS